jgi:hypothetical protein
MRNKAQLTIFTILSLLILLAAGSAFYLSSSQASETPENHNFQSYGPVLDSFVESCLQETTIRGIYSIGNVGGYYRLPYYSLQDDYFNIPFYFYEDLPSIPSKQEIETQLSLFVDDKIADCLDNFTSLKNQGLRIEYTSPKTTMAIHNENIVASLNFPIRLSQNDESLTKSQFSTNVHARLYSMYLVAQNITLLHNEDPTGVCLDCIWLLQTKYNLTIDVIKYLNYTLIINVQANDRPDVAFYNFTFALQYPRMTCDHLGPTTDVLFIQDCLNAQILELQ